MKTVLIVAAIAIGVSFHFWPKETTSAGKSALDKATRAGKVLAQGTLKAGEEVIK